MGKEVQHARDARVAQSAQDLHLFVEAVLDDVGAGAQVVLLVHLLEGADPPAKPRILNLIDRSHAAALDTVDHGIATFHDGPSRQGPWGRFASSSASKIKSRASAKPACFLHRSGPGRPAPPMGRWFMGGAGRPAPADMAVGRVGLVLQLVQGAEGGLAIHGLEGEVRVHRPNLTAPGPCGPRATGRRPWPAPPAE